MIRVVAIFGPTASGKSSLALKLAKKHNGVIISVDSMQLYRGMNIGTAKPTIDEMQEVPHRMIDILDPGDSFSVYDFKKQAEDEIRAVVADGKLPILVGGTGLYFDALFYNTQFGEMDTDPEIHQKLLERVQNGENKVLLEELRSVDPKCAAPLHPKDTKRILRALEVYLSTGKTLTQFKEESHKVESDFHFLKLNLIYRDRATLYERINFRVEEMFRLGLLKETQEIYENHAFDGTAAQAIGYKELLPYLAGENSLEECKERLKTRTRNYAKRQITWFKRYQDALPIIMDGDSDPLTEAESLLCNFLKGE